MNATIKLLPEMKAICFEGFSKDSEIQAFTKMKEWIKESGSDKKTYRIFGHNIDSQGNITYGPKHAGYKILLDIDLSGIDTADLKTEIIQPGKFLVVRTEGEIGDVGNWLAEGWNKINDAIRIEKHKIKSSPRWFEEHIKTPKPDYVIVDLYIEIE